MEQAIIDAIKARQVIEIVYKHQRRIEPHCLFRDRGQELLLSAYDRTARGWRTFRVAEIDAVVSTQDEFAVRSDYDEASTLYHQTIRTV